MQNESEGRAPKRIMAITPYAFTAVVLINVVASLFFLIEYKSLDGNLKTKRSDLATVNQDLKSLDSKRDELEGLTAAIAQAKATISAASLMEVEVENLTQAQEKLQANRSKLTDQIREDQDRQEEFERATSAIRESNASLKDEESLLKKNTRNLSDTVNRLKQQKADLETENDRLASSIIDRKASANLSGEILALKGEIDGLKAQKQTLEQEVSATAGQAHVQARQRAEAEYWKEQVTSGLVNELEGRKQTLEKLIRELEKKKGELEAAIDEGADQ